MHFPFRALGFALLLASAARAEEIAVPGGVVDVRYPESEVSEAWRAAVRGWVSASARAVAGYYGRFPAPRALLKLTPVNGHEPRGGQASGWNGPVVTLSLGRRAAAADLADEWMLTHEFLHLGFPDLEERHHWLEEGLAVYCESVARARAGLISPEHAWGDLFEGVPQGQPEAGDRGLDHTHTWGRTYWGGALFCLRADVEIRRRTGGKRGLEHALRAIIAAGGTIEHSWPIEKVIATGDAATGVPVLREAYDAAKDQPAPVDLEALWRSLGVEKSGSGVRLLKDAPLRAVRQAIIPEGAPAA